MKFPPSLKIYAILLHIIFCCSNVAAENLFIESKSNTLPEVPAKQLLVPIANVDTITVSADSTTFINVLANDIDPGGNPLTLDTIIYGPLYGLATISNSLIAYTPQAYACGLVDTLIYRIKDINNFTDTALVIIHISGISPPIPTANTPLCVGSTLQLNCNGYFEGDYSWSGPSGFSSLDQNPVIGNVNLTNSGTYYVSVSTGGCNSDTVGINVIVIPPPTVTLPPDTTLCNGDSITIDAGTGYNYIWSNGSSTQIITIYSTGTYTITVSNICGTASDNIQITFLEIPKPQLGPDTSICTGNTLTLSANTAAQNYLWNNGSTQSSITVSASGTYWVSATNQCGTGSDTIVVQINNPLPPFSLGSDSLLCNGDSVLLNAGSGIGLTYLWSTGATTQTIYVAAPGSYIVTVTNACGSMRDTINFSIDQVPVVNLGPDTNLCFGTTIILNGPGNATSFQWSDGSTGSQLTVDTTGTYWLIAANLCGSDSDTIAFNSFDYPPAVNLGNDTLLCDGIALLLDAGGGYVYNWSNGASTQTVAVDSQGTYIVTVSNTCGSATDAINITTELTPVVDFGPDTTLCAGATSLLIGPGNATSYLWHDGSTLGSFSVDTLGIYWLIATNICGADTDSISFTAFVQLPVVDLPADTLLCNGDSIALDAGVGYVYQWSDGSTTQVINVSAQGTYTVTVTNVCGSAADQLTISNENTPDANLGGDTVLCITGATLLAGPANATSWLWNDGSTGQSISADTLGTYWLIASNICGTDTDSVTFYGYVQPPTVFLGNDTLLCDGISTTLDAGSGFLYLWSDGSSTQTIDVSAQGYYTVTVTNVCGSISDSIFISNEATPVVNLGNDTYLCQNAVITLTGPSNATLFQWNDGSTNQTFDVDTIGQYWLIASNICGSDTDSVYITPQINLPTVDLGNDQLLCNGGSALLSADTGYTYLWNDGTTNQTIVVTTAGTYIVTVDNGCGTASDTVVITTGVDPVVNLGNDTTICQGDSLALSGPGNAVYFIWNNDSTYPSLVTDTAGTYWLIASNLCGSDTDSITINAVIPLPVADLGNDTLFCNGNSVVLSADSGFNYIWNTGSTSQSITASTSGTYIVTVSNTCGVAIDSVQLTAENVPQVSLPGDTSLCTGSSLTITVTGNVSNYVWSDGSTNAQITVDTTGSYWVAGTNSCGTASDTLNINTINPLPVINLGNDTSFCQNDFLHLVPGNFSAYLWQDGSTNSFYHVSQQGTYWVVVTDANGCMNSDTITVDSVFGLPAAFLPPDTAICKGDTLTLYSLNNYNSYVWNNGSTNNTLTINEPGSYWLAVTDANGCPGLDSILIANSCDSLDSVIFIPNVFTPNDDAQNNTWHATGLVAYFEVVIVDRWGIKMFEANSITTEWDGKNNGKNCPEGVYYYIAKYRVRINDEVKTKSGFITLLR